MNSFFALISRMRYISRWGLMRNSMAENVQEHSHMVAVLTHALALIRRDVFSRPCEVERLVTAALYHDASEILTGDLPTPIKYHDANIRAAYKQVEQQACIHLVNMVPVELRDSFRPVILMDVGKEGEALIKAADKLSALIKCIEERKAGNLEFSSAEAQTRAALAGTGLPEVDWFMDRLLPAFECNLDELETIPT